MKKRKPLKVTLPFYIIFKIFRTHIKDTISAKLLTYQNISHTTYEAVSVFSAHGTWMYLQLEGFKNLNYFVGHMEH